VTVRVRDRGFDRRSIVVLGVAGASAVAGLGAGMLATNTDRPRVASPPTPGTLRAGALALQLPPGWSELQRAPRLDRLTGPGAIAVRGEYSDVVIVKRRLEGPTLLPRAFVESVATPLPRPTQVRIGERNAYHYGDLLGLLRDARVDVFALPTTKGVATVACIADVATVQSTDDCMTALDRLELRGATAVDAQPGVAVALTLHRTITRLDATRLRVRRQLATSRYPAPRRAAAERLSRAHDRAAAELAVMADTTADRATVVTLRAVAAAYRSYAAASARRDVRNARAAAQRLRSGERELTRRLAARTAFRLNAT